MRSAEQMVQAIHEQAAELRRKRDRRRRALAGGASGILSVVLVVLIGSLGGLRHIPLNGNLAGASLLDDSTGGYVLAAVVAFMTGVAVTAFLMWRQNRKGAKGHGSRTNSR